MDKSVLRSIKPYWLYLILIGKKTVEIAKTVPKLESWNRKVFFYCSKDKKSFNRIPAEHREMMSKYIGKIACEFLCNEIEDFSKWTYDYPSLLRHINLYAGTNGNYKFLDSYLGKKTGYGLYISNLVIYDKPKNLSNFVLASTLNTDCFGNHSKTLSRPPQSWCYINEVKNND